MLSVLMMFDNVIALIGVLMVAALFAAFFINDLDPPSGGPDGYA